MAKRLKGQRVDEVVFKGLTATIRFHKNGIDKGRRRAYSNDPEFSADYAGEYICFDKDIKVCKRNAREHLASLLAVEFIPLIRVNISTDDRGTTGGPVRTSRSFSIQYSRYYASSKLPARWCMWGTPEEQRLASSNDQRWGKYDADGNLDLSVSPQQRASFSRDGLQREIYLPYTRETWQFLEDTNDALKKMYEKVDAFFVGNEGLLAQGLVMGNLLGTGERK